MPGYSRGDVRRNPAEKRVPPVFAWESGEVDPSVPVGAENESTASAKPEGDSLVKGAEAGEGVGMLTRIDRLFAFFDRCIERALPESLNPLARTGAIANTCLVIAIVTGFLLLFWYSPSVHKAYDSLEALREHSPLGQFVRSLHRYSSDACLLFILIHAVRMLVGLKFTGPRSLAWVSGVGLLGLIWFIGWTGYWLVWDERAQVVAEGTARFLSVIPVLGEPLARSFLVNENIPSLLFFLVFFLHMLLPLALGLILWLHLSRVSRPKLLTGRALTLWILGTLTVMALIFPAESAQRADLSTRPDGFNMDWWYLWPVVLTDRLGGGLLWLVFFIGTLGLCALPWSPLGGNKGIQRSVTARVDRDACQGCTLCSKDCPFDAITMVKRESGGQGSRWLASVNTDRCVGCGICTGACDSDAIALPGFEIPEEKESLARWVRERRQAGEPAFPAYVCGRILTGSRFMNPATLQSPLLPGYRVRSVPCAGWVGAPLIEYALEAGASGVLVAGCGSREPRFREGAEWLEKRLDGRRKPFLRRHRADRNRVLFLKAESLDRPAVIEAAAAFRAGRIRASSRPPARLVAVVAGVALAGMLGLAAWLGSELPYRPPASSPEWVVSFNHTGERLEAGRDRSEEDDSRRLAHMRGGSDISGERAPVRLRIWVDGELHLDREYRPRGLRRDGPSTALESVTMSEGTNRLRVQLNDTADPEVWPHEWTETVEVSTGDRRVLLFDDGEFRLY